MRIKWSASFMRINLIRIKLADQLDPHEGIHQKYSCGSYTLYLIRMLNHESCGSTWSAFSLREPYQLRIKFIRIKLADQLDPR